MGGGNFTDAERAALELTEQGTRIADAVGGVPDAVWANAEKHYDEERLAALVLLIALIHLQPHERDRPAATSRASSLPSDHEHDAGPASAEWPRKAWPRVVRSRCTRVSGPGARPGPVMLGA